MAKVLALVLILAGLFGGAAAGHLLKPEPPEAEAVEGEAHDEDGEAPHEAAPAPEAHAASAHGEEGAPVDTTVSFRDGFVVPILRDGRVWSNVILTLGVETKAMPTEEVLLREALLRDGLNEALFVHGSLGGFDGDFTDPMSLNRLRLRLNEVLRSILPDPDARILIGSLARQGA